MEGDTGGWGEEQRQRERKTEIGSVLACGGCHSNVPRLKD